MVSDFQDLGLGVGLTRRFWNAEIPVPPAAYQKFGIPESGCGRLRLPEVSDFQKRDQEVLISRIFGISEEALGIGKYRTGTGIGIGAPLSWRDAPMPDRSNDTGVERLDLYRQQQVEPLPF
jgi:hypothetical protein